MSVDVFADAVAEALAARLRPQPRGEITTPEQVLDLAEAAATRVAREGTRGATSLSTDQIIAMAAVIAMTGVTEVLRELIPQARARATENPQPQPQAKPEEKAE